MKLPLSSPFGVTCLIKYLTPMAFTPTILFLFLLIALVGCSKHQKIKHDLVNYQQRLSDFTQIELLAVDMAISLDSPTQQELVFDIPHININLRDFYALKQCEVNRIIAERNTALGKTQLPSIRYIYEMKVTQALAQCVEWINTSQSDGFSNDNKDMLTKLTFWLGTKRRALPLAWSNMITQSDEIFFNLTTTGDFLSAEADDSIQSNRLAWQYLLDSAQLNPLNSSMLEAHLYALSHDRLLARMWKSQILISRFLQATSPVLQRYLTLNTCKTPKQRSDIMIMQNIFRLYFVEDIQSFATTMNSYHYQLFPILLSISKRTDVHPLLAEYLQRHLIQHNAEYKLAMANHIKLWQSIFATCDNL